MLTCSSVCGQHVWAVCMGSPREQRVWAMREDSVHGQCMWPVYVGSASLLRAAVGFEGLLICWLTLLSTSFAPPSRQGFLNSYFPYFPEAPFFDPAQGLRLSETWPNKTSAASGIRVRAGRQGRRAPCPGRRAR